MPPIDAQTNPNAGEEELDKLIYALSFHLRRRILRALLSKDASAKELAQRLGAKHGDVNYHLNTVLAKQCGLVRLVRTHQRRGGTEKTYTIQDHVLWAPAIWRGLQPGPGQLMQQLSLRELLVQVLAVSEHGHPAALTWQATEVDEPGWQEILAAADQFQRTVAAAIERVRKQDGSGDCRPNIRMIAGIAVFQPASAEAVDRWAQAMGRGS